MVELDGSIVSIPTLVLNQYQIDTRMIEDRNKVSICSICSPLNCVKYMKKHTMKMSEAF